MVLSELGKELKSGWASNSHGSIQMCRNAISGVNFGKLTMGN